MENRIAFLSLLLSLGLMQLAVCQDSPDCSALQVPFSGAPFSGELLHCTAVHRENSTGCMHACVDMPRPAAVQMFNTEVCMHVYLEESRHAVICSKSVVVHACSMKLSGKISKTLSHQAKLKLASL